MNTLNKKFKIDSFRILNQEYDKWDLSDPFVWITRQQYRDYYKLLNGVYPRSCKAILYFKGFGFKLLK